MEIINYFESSNQRDLIEKIARCDWSAAGFLAELLRKGTFYSFVGGAGTLYLLMEGGQLVSFATLTRQDSIRDETLYPWIGFVYTAPEYRGHGYAGKILAHAEGVAAQHGCEKVYLTTDHVGLYEKYGYQYLENRLDIWGGDQRILYKEWKGAILA